MTKRVFIFLLLFLFPAFVWAQSPKVVKTDIVDTYILNHTSAVEVKREITLENTTDKYYVSEYSVSFSTQNPISNIGVWENGQTVNFSQTNSDGNLDIKIPLAQMAGKGQKKTIQLNFTIADFLNQAGNYGELIIPVGEVLKEESLNSYRVLVITPSDFPSAGISKPPVQNRQRNVYEWSNLIALKPQNLYISFGQQASYKVKLLYSFNNQDVVAKKAQIPLVPDGTYQKTYLTRLNPLPQLVETDKDNNLLATYYLGPKTKMEITYEGVVVLNSRPREEVINYYQANYNQTVLARYLSEEKYWRLEKPVLQGGSSAQEIYNFVVNKLNYDDRRVNDKLTRMGASWALLHPTEAVCMEFTDLFIALARQKSLPAREVVGYVYGNDLDSLPSSFLGDVLHAWPEYFDQARQYWQAIDPTFGKTTGLDYFFNLDLSHLTFVYHGQDTTYPLPPGVYKTKKNQTNIFVEPTTEVPKEKIAFELNLPEKIVLSKENTENKITLKLKSKSNIILYQPRFLLSSGKLKSNTVILPVFPPESEQALTFIIKTPKNLTPKTGVLKLTVNGQEIAQINYEIQSALSYFWQRYRLVLLIGLPLLIIMFWRKKV